MIRCKTCVIPNTRPDTAFIAGECSACVSYRKRATIDWDARQADLLRILETAKPNSSGYDCIVPSSGGKDSTWQVLKMIELGARPLVVTATTCMLTEIGRKNIDNLARYATTIEVTLNKTVRAKLNKLGLQLVGDISHPEHMAIFTTPFKVAADMGISLIMFGENPQDCYGGPLGTDSARELTERWRSEFAGFLGLRPADLVGKDGITELDMRDYMLPPSEKLQGMKAYFLGQFYQWDSHRNAEVAEEHGMITRMPTDANWWRAENLDCAMTGLHDYMMFRKYGYGRGAAQISVDIRAGLVSRHEALEWVAEWDGAFPNYYMGVPLTAILDHIGMTRAELDETIERFSASH